MVYLFLKWIHIILNEAPNLRLLLKFFLKRDKITLHVSICYYFGKRKNMLFGRQMEEQNQNYFAKDIMGVCMCVCM